MSPDTGLKPIIDTAAGGVRDHFARALYLRLSCPARPVSHQNH
jgi:hypothetical protein